MTSSTEFGRFDRDPATHPPELFWECHSKHFGVYYVKKEKGTDEPYDSVRLKNARKGNSNARGTRMVNEGGWVHLGNGMFGK